MAKKRLYVRAGEVATLFGEDTSRSEWQLWRDMTDGQDTGVGEYGRWQSRLAVPVMQGIAEDHRLKVERALGPDDIGPGCAIMPPRAWLLAPNMATEGRPAILVVQQRTGGSLRDWKAPDRMPPKHLRRHMAIATAYGLRDVVLGVLVDGYSSDIYRISAEQEQRDEIAKRVAEFVRLVETGEEPDIDFTGDETAVRQGLAVTRTEASTEILEGLLNERAGLMARQQPMEVGLKQIAQRLRTIDTTLIHMAGADGRLQVGTRLVAITRDGRNNPKIDVVDTAAAPLF